MNTTTVVVIVIVVVAIVLIASVVSEIARRRSARPQEGPRQEYDEGVGTAGDRRHAGPQPPEPENRRETLNLRTLPPEARQRYRDEWHGIQQRFVEVPGKAVQDADRLVQVIMRDIGYPVDDFEQRAEEVSAEHPEIVRHYRSAHAVAAAQQRGQAETGPLRQAAGDYRVLVDDLLAQGRG
jgi:hypothetical protein